MASLKDEINAIEWFTLEPDGSGTINEAQKALRDAKIAALKGKIVDKAAIVNAKNQALVNQLGSLAAINNGVQLMATASEQNLKSANAYLLAMHAPSFSGFTEADMSALADIADQCVGEGGEGVLLARGLLASATWAVTEYDDACVQELGEREDGQAPVPVVAQGSLQVFPNPANGTAHIVVPAHLQGQPVAIRNLYGHTVALVETVPGQPSVRLDLSGYAPGMYFAAMEGQNTVRFVVAR
ncbi:MAG: T9SS type A sorting domain-containing protein [Saprospiraceae bacterium]|nr:T9SS type A sorting domain-containing protein [Saprospiraceae bacterium]MCF8251091.1 T9SS type A sorting domain-containing protein [Saprospiraceae bacterium]MCF8280993.1 T9SS type A sorting domain-containing protein [Bacteroidales bacterium]MCF8312951.1 T9SS type A sorting domain-containing protein [Saprospiraceae bacterium]MCF8441350.1 T9SS type A sorting domain-containing protein [Saprospiraceae bacterium]